MNKCSILIIDDDQEDRYLLKRLLKRVKVNCNIYEAENGQIALDLLVNHKESFKQQNGESLPLIVFLDINMPVMGGFEFLKNFHEYEDKKIIDTKDFKSVFFTMFSSSNQQEDIQKAKSFGYVKGYVTKGNLTEKILIKVIQDSFPDDDFFVIK